MSLFLLLSGFKRLAAALTAFVCWFLISVQLTSKPTTFTFLAWRSAKNELALTSRKKCASVRWRIRRPVNVKIRILVTNWYFYLNSGWFHCRYHWSLRCPPCEWIYFGLLFFSWCRWYSPFPVKHDVVLGSKYQAVSESFSKLTDFLGFITPHKWQKLFLWLQMEPGGKTLLFKHPPWLA